MATDYSKTYVKRAGEKLRFTRLYFIMKFSRWINKYRAFRRKLSAKQVKPSTLDPEITANLERETGHFQKNHWLFLENVISAAFHKELVSSWPSKFFLNSPKKITKSYNTGFSWTRGGPPPQSIERFSAFLKFFNYLQSPEFQKRITNFVGLSKDFVCYSFVINSTFTGSEVIPHKDGIYHNPNAEAFINIVFFINGTGGQNSGGLMLARDNELQDIIVEPSILYNTCLIYDSKADFYHGFPPVERGKFRWAINAQFCDKNFVESANRAGL